MQSFLGSRGGAAALGALLLSLALASGAASQSPPTVLPPDRIGVKSPRTAAERADVPATGAPCCAEVPAEPVLPPLPRGVGGNPEPKSRPATEATPSGGPAPAAGAFTFFKNTIVKPPGARRSTASQVSPSCINVQDTVFQTGNWYAALSKDTGQSWINLDPGTFFPAQAGGFCCNQRVQYVPSHDIALWLLEYSYSPLTQKGGYQIAVANGQSELRSGNANDWTLYWFDSQDFGFPLGTTLDSPDLSFNRDWLYASSNVLSGNNVVGAVVWRMSLYDLQQNGSLTFTYLTDATMGGNSYRFADHAGDGTNMYWATLMSTTTLRVWRQNTIGINRDYVDVTTAPWQVTGSITCAGPDNRGWVGTSFGRIRGACGTNAELVFAWPCHENGITRPYPYTRVTRLTVASRTLIAEDDIFSSDRCWSNMALDSTSLGHVGGIVATGGPSDYVRTAGFLIDGYTTWNSLIAYRVGTPTNNPPGGAFGAYFDVQRSSVDGRTLIGTGNLMVGGDAESNVDTRHVWFGRDDYQPAWANLAVVSTPVQGIAITLDATDNLDRKDGPTNLQREYAPGQGLRVTAPTDHSTGTTSYRFKRWVLGSVAQPDGERNLTIPSLGSSGALAEAQYRAIRSIRFDASTHLTAGARIATPTDLDGNGNGTTVFSRRYLQGAQITISVLDPVVQGHPFKSWVIDGNRYPPGQQSVGLTLGNANVNATAEYWEYLPGSFTSFGTGCTGNNGVDIHSGAGTPELGQTLQWRLQGGAPLAAAVLWIGASNTSWSGTPLPLLIPDAGNCMLRVSIDVSLPTATNATGLAAIPLLVPTDPALLGGVVHTQFGCVDAPANVLGITLSNGVSTRLGGLR